MGVDAAVRSTAVTESIGCTTSAAKEGNEKLQRCYFYECATSRASIDEGARELGRMEEHQTVEVFPPLPLLIEWLMEPGALTIPSAIDTSSFAQTATYSHLCPVGTSLSNS